MPPEVKHVPVLETELLRTFIAVVDNGSFTKAASALGLSQPTVSGHLRRLQEQIGTELLDKSVPGVKLTDQGHVALGYARQIVLMHDEMFRKIDDRGSLKNIVRVGIPFELRCWSLIPALAEFRPNNPGIDFNLLRMPDENLLRDLQRGKMDIAVTVTENKPSEDALCSWKESLSWVGTDQTAAHSKPIEIVAHPDGSIARRIMLAALDNAGIEYRIVLSAPHIEGAIVAAKAGLGFIALLGSNISQPLVPVDTAVGLPSLRRVYWNIHLNEETRSAYIEQLARGFARTLGALSADQG